jgi:hypothetical protein
MRKLILMLAGLALLGQAANAQTAPAPETAPAGQGTPAVPEAGKPTAPSAPKAEPDPRVKKLLEARKIEYEITKAGNFKVVFSLKGGRTKMAFISSATYRYMNLEIREIASPAYRSAAPFTAEVANRLLSDNNDKKLGAWVMQKGPDGYYALFVTKIGADSSEETFVGALRLTLEAADEMEKELTGKDEF